MGAHRIEMTRQRFEQCLADGSPGDKIIYHVGFLLWDTHYGIDYLRVRNNAAAAWEALEAGKVTLVQEKVMDGIWKYIAIVRRPPHKKVQWQGCYLPPLMPKKKHNPERLAA